MHRSVNTVIAPATERREAEPRVDCPVTTSVLIILTIKTSVKGNQSSLI